jgi:hypothetical protein
MGGERPKDEEAKGAGTKVPAPFSSRRCWCCGTELELVDPPGWCWPCSQRKFSVD